MRPRRLLVPSDVTRCLPLFDLRVRALSDSLAPVEDPQVGAFLCRTGEIGQRRANPIFRHFQVQDVVRRKGVGASG